MYANDMNAMQEEDVLLQRGNVPQLRLQRGAQNGRRRQPLEQWLHSGQAPEASTHHHTPWKGANTLAGWWTLNILKKSLIPSQKQLVPTLTQA